MSCWASIMPERRLLSATRVRAALLSRLTLATSITPTIPADTIASTRLKPRARRCARAIARRQWEGRWKASVFMGTRCSGRLWPGILVPPLDPDPQVLVGRDRPQPAPGAALERDAVGVGGRGLDADAPGRSGQQL